MSAIAAAQAAADAVPTALLLVTKVMNLAVVVCAIAVLSRTRRSPAAGWALAMFSDLGLIVLLGFFPVTDDGSWLRHGYVVVVVCVLLLVPYLLVRFALSLGAISTTTHRIAATLTGLQLFCTAISPPFPKEGAPRSAWFMAFLVLVLVGWTYQSVMSAIGLWSAGRGQPSVVRHRMRALSLGAVILALGLVAGSGSDRPNSAVNVATSLIGVLGISLLVLAFVVPPWLAAVWRADDLGQLGVAERNLMAAVTPETVGSAVVPAVVQLFGASGAALLDGEGRVIVEQGNSSEELADRYRELSQRTGDEVVLETEDGAFACRLEDGWLILRPGSFAPLFGTAEMVLLDRVGSFTDLALQRCRLFEEEARSRKVAEAANAELQTLIYSVSHDLRNPIISVLGYLDVLAREHPNDLQGEGNHYLQRISVNALYMQSLIGDLLELSRIGRSEPPSLPVPLGALAESVAHEVRVMHPDCEITVEGEFPIAWMSELRARQLLTNLLDNSAKYTEGDAHVSVRAVPDGSGGALLTVADDGPGIPEQYREKAFDVFERLQAAHTEVSGTGMGLPICKRIIETLGGSITLGGPTRGQASGITASVRFPSSVVQGWTSVLSSQKENAS